MATKKKVVKKRKNDAKTATETVSEKVAQMPLNLLLTIAEVTALTGMCYETLWRRWTTGKMPKPIKLGHRTKRFKVADIKAWVDNDCKWPVRKVGAK
jgi:predicted DNA-binding transcriptional regulator AlpA